MVVNGRVSDGVKYSAPAYAGDLLLARNQVLESIDLPIYHGPIRQRSITLIMNYMWDQLETGLKTHLTFHAHDCLKNWFNNQIRAGLSKNDYDAKHQRSVIGKWRKKVMANDPEALERYPSLWTDFNEHKKALEAAFDPQHQHSIQPLLEYFHRLRVQVDKLEEKTGRAMKTMAVIPQAKIAMGAIKIDNSVAKYLVTDLIRNANLEGLENNHDPWSVMFDLRKISKLRTEVSGTRFGLSIQTDGVAAMVMFKTKVLKSELPKRVRKRKRTVKADATSKTDPPPPPRIVDGPGIYEEHDTHPVVAGLVAVDPGVKSLITAVHLGDHSRKPFQVSQKEYRDGCMLNYRSKKADSDDKELRRRMNEAIKNAKDVGRNRENEVEVSEIINLSDDEDDESTGTPRRHKNGIISQKSVLHFDDYITQLRSTWDISWAHHTRLKFRKLKFFVWRRRESWMDKLVNRFRDYVGGDNPTVLFGNGADSGLFGRLRGCGVKGPVLELRKRLAEKMVIIGCSEYRTSKLCLECGCKAKFYNHGVTYCQQQSHHRMENRDVAAAYKIGARHLATNMGLDLGPWSRQVNADALDDGSTDEPRPLTNLQRMLLHYQQFSNARMRI